VIFLSEMIYCKMLALPHDLPDRIILANFHFFDTFEDGFFVIMPVFRTP